MQTVTLGKTGITVNKNGFGALPIQRISQEEAVKLARKAYEAGHRRIAFIHGEVGSVTNARIDGFRKECESLAIDIPAEYIQSGCYHEPDSSRVITKKLMSLPVPPTCILFPDDYASFGGLNELEKMGYS